MVLAARAAGRRHDRHPLAEEPHPHHQQGLCQPDLSWRCAPAPSTAPGSGAFAQNDKLRDVTLIGLGRIEAPEDVILDRNDNLYAGSRHGDIMRFLAPDYKEMEVFAHIGGQPLGMAFDRNDNLYVCIGGMGLYRITPERKVEKVDRRDQPQPLFGQRRQPPAARRRSRHRRRRPHFLFRSHRPLRDARMAGRRAGSARQWPHHLLRPEQRARRARCCAD